MEREEVHRIYIIRGTHGRSPDNGDITLYQFILVFGESLASCEHECDSTTNADAHLVQLLAE
jgi:hypothetical protein